MNLEICVEKDDWNKFDLKGIAQECVDAVVESLDLDEEDHSDDLEICFLFTDDEEVRQLNKTYRGIDKATNVLSFPMQSYDEDSEEVDEYQHFDPEEEEDYEEEDAETSDDESFENGGPENILGSVALAYETISREVSESARPLAFEDHLKHLIIHSILHLIGYDHQSDSEAEEMESLEIEILAQIGVENPYKY